MKLFLFILLMILFFYHGRNNVIHDLKFDLVWFLT